MSKLHLATRHRTLRMLAAVPYLLLPRSVLAAAPVDDHRQAGRGIRQP